MKTTAPPIPTIRIRSGLAGLVASIVLAATPSTQAITLSFARVTNNSPSDYSSQLSAEITDLGAGALFVVSLDAAPLSGDIRNIFVEDIGGLFSSMDFSTTFTPGAPTVVAFSSPSSPASPPGIGPFTPTYSFDADGPMPQIHAINNDESGAFIATYFGGTSSADVAQALANGTLRMALHMQSLDPGGSESDSYLSQPIPEPSLVFLATLGLTLILVRRR